MTTPRLAWIGVCAATLAMGCSPAGAYMPVAADEGREAGARDASPSASDGSAADAGGDSTASASTDDAGAAVDTGVSSDASNEAATPVDSGADGSGPGVTMPAAVCNPAPTWGSGISLGIAMDAGAELGAITPDELTIAWTYTVGTTVALAWADRATSSDAFGAPQMVQDGTFADDRVAVSPDGLRLIVVNADRQGFSELTRTARTGAGSAFGAPAVGSYVNFDSAGLSSGQSLGDPVVSASDTAFYYSLYDGVQSATIYRTARLLPGDAWPLGAPLSGATQLAANGSKRRRPTAVSSDEQTLFFWDEVGTQERAAWIDPVTGDFDTFVDLGMRWGAGPNAACTRLYYSAAADGGSPDLLVTAP